MMRMVRLLIRLFLVSCGYYHVIKECIFRHYHIEVVLVGERNDFDLCGMVNHA